MPPSTNSPANEPRMPASDLPLAHLEAVMRNPANPRHMMMMKPLAQEARIYARINGHETLIAKSTQAQWVIEFGKTLYSPMLYIPAADLVAPLSESDKTTHCPLKGDASYYDFEGEELGWAYNAPFDFAAPIAHHHCFWPDKVRLEIGDKV